MRRSRHSKGVGDAQPDYVRAYLLIEQKLLELVDRKSVCRSERTMLAAVDDSLRYVGGYMDPQQTQAAEALAKQLLAENANCCSGSIFA